MARMYPPELPIGVVLDKTQQDLVAFYNVLAQNLGDEFHVFYNCIVEGVELEHDKPLDFLILHNKLGALAIEVFRGDVPNGLSNGGLKTLPYAQVRMAVHSFIFGLKERGIRFYIPAPCCVVFPKNARNEFETSSEGAEYIPLFFADYQNIEKRITAMMPLRSGHASNWSVPDAIDRIAPLIAFNNGASTVSRTGKGQRGKKRQDEIYYDEHNRPRIIYVVRAIDVFLVLINILVLAAIVFFMPESFAQRVAVFLKN